MGKIKMPSARKLEQDFTLERAFDAFVKSSAARGLAEKTLQTYPGWKPHAPCRHTVRDTYKLKTIVLPGKSRPRCTISLPLLFLLIDTTE